MNYILRAGAQAPSMYNCQPWKFHVVDNRIDLYLYEEADTSFFNWNNVLSMITCGGVVENILIGAEGRGLEARLQEFPESTDPLLVARITLFPWAESKDSRSGAALEQAIWRRHTNTLDFDNRRLTEEEERELRVSAAADPRVSLHLLQGDEEKQRVFGAVSCAEQVRFARKELHEQFHSMIRWDDEAAFADRTGYTLPSTGICGIGELLFRLTAPWSVMRIMNLLGGYGNLARRGCLGLVNCSAVGLLTVEGDTNMDLLAGGRVMERLWLTATRLGLDLHPHTPISLFHWSWLSGGAELYTAWERKILLRAFRLYAEAFPDAELGKKARGVFLFRVGEGKPVAGYTLRKGLTEIVTRAE